MVSAPAFSLSAEGAIKMVARIFLSAAALGAAAVVAQVPNTPPTYQLNMSTIIMVRARRAMRRLMSPDRMRSGVTAASAARAREIAPAVF